MMPGHEYKNMGGMGIKTALISISIYIELISAYEHASIISIFVYMDVC
jgi:hypothetical protein